MKEPYHGLLVLNRFSAMDFTAEKPYIVISITDPDKPDVLLQPSSNLIGVLRLRFHDIEEPYREFVLMIPEQAAQIADFVRRWQPEVELIVVQCEGGISRSAAIAAAIAHWSYGDDQYFIDEFLPNRHVFNLVRMALGGVPGDWKE
ncbi:MAG: hypothetical protein ACYC6A_06775 [Armatimonadota bacterium]